MKIFLLLREKLPPIAASLLFLFFLIPHCQSVNVIVYQYRSVAEPTSAPERRISHFDEFKILRFHEKRRGIEITGTLYQKEYFKTVARALNSGAELPGRVPDLFPVKMQIFNYGESPVRIDFYRFILRNTRSGETFPCLRPEKYQAEVYMEGLSSFPYFWAFEQKEGFRFLHPLPDWYFLGHRPMTPSRGESDQRIRQDLASISVQHSHETLVSPGHELKGILLFPEIPAGQTYSLEITPVAAGSEKVSAAERIFEFTPLVFELRAVRYEADLEEESPLLDKKWEDILEAEETSDRRSLRDLYVMHRQYEEHEKVSTGRNPTAGP